MIWRIRRYWQSLIVLIVAAVVAAAVGHVYFHAGFPYTHDGENHLARFANYALALREGQFPPRWAPNLFNHYGYPVFDFNYPLANILSLPFSFLKINPEVSFKVIVLAGLLFGCVGSYLWLRRLGYRFTTAVLGMIFFGVQNYVVEAIVIRGSIGEVLAICLLPWLFWVIEGVRQTTRWRVAATIFGGLLGAAFLLSHNIAAIYAVPILALYVLIRHWAEIKSLAGSVRDRLASLASGRRVGWAWVSFRKGPEPVQTSIPIAKLAVIASIAIGLSLWFWLPAIAEKGLTVVDSSGVNQAVLDHFPTIHQLLFSTNHFGFSFEGPVDSLSFALGLVQLLILILAVFEVGRSIWLNTRSKQSDSNIPAPVVWSLLIAGLLFFVQLPFTQPLWQVFLFADKYLQFPWRVSLFWGVALLPAFGYVWERASRGWHVDIVLVLLWQVLALLRVVPADYFHRTLVDYQAFSQSTSTLNENRTREFTYISVGDWQPTPQVLSGSATASVQSWRGSNRRYTLNASTPVMIVEPTMAFAGWQTRSNGELVKYLQNDQVAGRIAYELPAGSYTITSRFTQWTWSRVVGNAVAVLTALALAVILGRTIVILVLDTRIHGRKKQAL